MQLRLLAQRLYCIGKRSKSPMFIQSILSTDRLYRTPHIGILQATYGSRASVCYLYHVQRESASTDTPQSSRILRLCINIRRGKKADMAAQTFCRNHSFSIDSIYQHRGARSTYSASHSRKVWWQQSYRQRKGLLYLCYDYRAYLFVQTLSNKLSSPCVSHSSCFRQMHRCFQVDYNIFLPDLFFADRWDLPKLCMFRSNSSLMLPLFKYSPPSDRMRYGIAISAYSFWYWLLGWSLRLVQQQVSPFLSLLWLPLTWFSS